MKMILKYALFIGLMLQISSNVETTQEPAVKNDSLASPEDNSASGKKMKTIVFFGNSLSAGYGVAPEECFAGLAEQRIDSLGLGYKVINAGLSGETTAGGASRIDWILRQPIDIFILELGGNDGLRGLNPEDSFKNLQTIINKTKEKYPNVKIIIAGMQAPPNMGSDFTEKFKNVFPRLAKENDALLIPFLLEGVGGVPKLNLTDGIHPNPEGHKIVVETVWNTLKEVL